MRILQITAAVLCAAFLAQPAYAGSGTDTNTEIQMLPPLGQTSNMTASPKVVVPCPTQAGSPAILGWDGVDPINCISGFSADSTGDVTINNNANIGGNATVRGNATVNGNTTMNGNATVTGTTTIGTTLYTTGDFTAGLTGFNQNSSDIGFGYAYSSHSFFVNGELAINSYVSGLSPTIWLGTAANPGDLYIAGNGNLYINGNGPLTGTSVTTLLSLQTQNCGANQALTEVSNNQFECVNIVDLAEISIPRALVPACSASGESLTWNGSQFLCQAAVSVPSCGSGQVLTGAAGSLQCVTVANSNPCANATYAGTAAVDGNGNAICVPICPGGEGVTNLPAIWTPYWFSNASVGHTEPSRPSAGFFMGIGLTALNQNSVVNFSNGGIEFNQGIYAPMNTNGAFGGCLDMYVFQITCTQGGWEVTPGTYQDYGPTGNCGQDSSGGDNGD